MDEWRLVLPAPSLDVRRRWTRLRPERSDSRASLAAFLSEIDRDIFGDIIKRT